jgi:hypothetical protein
MDILKQLAKEAKDDGDTKEQWLSTLRSHLIFMFQQGKLDNDANIDEMVAIAPSHWQNDK